MDAVPMGAVTVPVPVAVPVAVPVPVSVPVPPPVLPVPATAPLRSSRSDDGSASASGTTSPPSWGTTGSASASGAPVSGTTSPTSFPPPSAPSSWFWQGVTAFWHGSLSGAAASLMLQPLDVIKTRQQGLDVSKAAPSPSSSSSRVSVRDAVREVWRQDGVAGFWRGIAPTVMRSSLGPGVYFVVLDALQSGRRGESHQGHKRRLFMEGASARAVAGTLLCPLSVVKTRFEFARGKAVEGTWQALVRIAREEKLRGLFRGAVPTLLRDVPSSGLYLLLYQGMLKPWSHKALQRSSHGHLVSQPMANLACSGAAGAVAALISHPADVLKTHVQLNKQGIFDGSRSLWAARGLLGFWSGASARLLRRPMSMAITWTIFEMLSDAKLE